jgi:N-acetylneuraminate lyase
MQINRIDHLVITVADIERTVDFYQRVLGMQRIEFAGGRYDMLFGRDEMLLSALVVGCKGAVGSTYNYAAPVYTSMIEAFNAGNLDEARRLQHNAARLVEILHHHGGVNTHKTLMRIIGIDCGPVRLPLLTHDPHQEKAFEADLREIGFFDWIS